MNRPLKTTLDIIAGYKPCEDGWLELLKFRGLAKCSIADFPGDSTLFNVSEIGKLGRVDWLCWTARLFTGDELAIYRWFALWCAERVKHLMKDHRSIKALEITHKFLSLEAGSEEIRAASAYAYAADADADADAYYSTTTTAAAAVYAADADASDAVAAAAAEAAYSSTADAAAEAAEAAYSSTADAAAAYAAAYSSTAAAEAAYSSTAAAAAEADADAYADAYRVAYDSEKSAQLKKLVSALESGSFTTANQEEEIK